MTTDPSTRTVLVTGTTGFVGRNLIARLRTLDGIRLLEYTRGDTPEEFAARAAAADVVYHLAGVNRPESTEEFRIGNLDFTEELILLLERGGRKPHLIFTSSVQAEVDNPYGRSKRDAERAVSRYAERTGAEATIFRLKNIFGKWSRPDYNSVVTTFCHNLARDLPITVRDPEYEIELIHIDDVVDALIATLDGGGAPPSGFIAPDTVPSHRITLGDLADRIRGFRAMRDTLVIPNLTDRFDQQLYGTYVSYVEPKNWEYGLDRKSDGRGDLAEFIKSQSFGQVFLSRTRPGVTRGGHYHHTKTEKFLVIAGEAVIRFRHVEQAEIIEFRVRGEDYRVVDIPPGYTHTITNIGEAELITIFWASEIFEPARSDTTFLPVDPATPVGSG